MASSSRLRLQDVRGVFRLVGELTELRLNPDAQIRRLIDGAIDLVGANHGHYVRFTNFTPQGEVAIDRAAIGGRVPEELGAVIQHYASLQQTGQYNLRRDYTVDRFTRLPGVLDRPMTRGRQELVSDEDWVASPLFDDFQSFMLGVGDIVSSTFPIGSPACVGGLALHRLEHDRCYSQRDCAVMALLNEELWHLYRQGKLTGAGTIEQELSPRQVQLLRMLLLGKTPKRIAYELGLAESTVRTYIRDLYRRVGVHGREELMSKYIREGGITDPDNTGVEI
ncbi:MAG: LuxR C-terminal-related transcriptional regulator [Planctomycetota bacterium]